MTKTIWTTLRKVISLLKAFDATGSIIEAFSKFISDLLDVKACEHLARRFALPTLAEQQSQEILEQVRDFFLCDKTGQFRRPNRVPSHSTSQE
jgi:hypothetical protein